MATKTDRILSYLPQTFKTSPRPAVLYPVADAFGNELLLGENSLAAIMLAHWVDFADKNALQIADLGKMAALYGLAPWLDESGNSLESVEEFREHLKHYVRTFLEGTVTVQGILRVTAEALALHIADAPDQLDRWWVRKQDSITSIEPLGNDAVSELNFQSLHASGSPALAAQVIGRVDLASDVNLQGSNMLRLKIDGTLDEIDLTEGLVPDATVSLDQIVSAINKAPRPAIATRIGTHLKLASPDVGPGSRLEIVNGPNDAGPRLLGLAPRTYHGAAATVARYVSPIEISNPIDLTNDRYLRIEIDGKHLEEVDCAGADAVHTTAAQVSDKINNAFPGLNVARVDGTHLVLTSPTPGIGGSIAVHPLTAQNAAPKVFGVASLSVVGGDAQPARADGARDLRGGIDLSQRSQIQLRIDGGAPVSIDCAGVEPAKTVRVEIVAAINKALGSPSAFVTEQGVSLRSPTAGPESEISFEQPATKDATVDVFGIDLLKFSGSGPTVARLTATPALTGNGVDVRANYFLSLAVDGATPIEIDLRQAAADYAELASLPLTKIAAHINQAFGGDQIASTDGEKLFLTSTRQGGAGRVEVLPRKESRQRRFVSRAIVTDEAADKVFGFVDKEAQGGSAVAARLKGTTDLSQSVDLTEARFLRLKMDGLAPVEIDCAGGRPRATTLAELTAKINSGLKDHGASVPVATDDGKHLILTSPSSNAGSFLAVDSPRVALDKLLGIEPGTVRGTDATSARFTATVDLTGGVDLAADAAIKLGIDDDAPLEIPLGGATPVHRSPSEIANAINTALKSPVAKTDGRRIELSSPSKGVESKINFEVPSAGDATKEIFGIAAPRLYHGDAATPARIVGLRELSAPQDLSAFRFLRLAIDGASEQTIDCAAKAAKPDATTLAEIVNSIGPAIASATADGKHLILTSTGTGPTAQITLSAFVDGDAARVLFGGTSLNDSGSPASPAVITGDNDLRLPVDLSRRSVLRLEVDAEPPVDIDVAGTVPAQTAVDEIISEINQIIPNLAAATADNQLQLTSPSTGPDSRLALRPLRYLEVIEYPPRTVAPLELELRHNGEWSIVNDGAADSFAEIKITAPQGTVGPGVVNTGRGWSIHLLTVLERGETARLFRDGRGTLRTEVIDLDGQSHPIDSAKILVGPLGAQAWVPFEKTWSLTGADERSLQLNNPPAQSIVLLNGLNPEDEITIDVLESDLSSLPAVVPTSEGEPGQLIGRLKSQGKNFYLVDASGSRIADLLAGPFTDPQIYLDHVVKVEGPLHAGTTPLLLIEKITSLFDVMVYCARTGSPAVNENYLRVSIGVGTNDADSLVRQINGGSTLVPASQLLRGEEMAKSLVLTVPSGKTDFRYLDCLGSRFDQARFDRSHFPDGVCGERGIFDVSRFSNSPPEKIRAVFVSDEPFSEPTVKIEVHWNKLAAGSFIVNLPADLPPRFGGRFDEARFGQEKDAPELFAGAVAEPVADKQFLVKLINGESGAPASIFVTATPVGSVELGWTPAHMPFRTPQFLTLGGPGRAARLYLSEDGLNGFIKLEAKEAGTWGNEISVAARPAGPAIYDVSIFYRGSCFEQACSIVMGAAKQTIAELLQPGPIGVLQAKAGGVRADVIRERADHDQLTITS
jgi:hypothetical protein